MTKQQKQLLLIGGAVGVGLYVLKKASQPQMAMPTQPMPGASTGGSLFGKLGELLGGVLKQSNSSGAKPASRTQAGTAPPPLSSQVLPSTTLGSLGGCTLGCTNYGSLGQ